MNEAQKLREAFDPAFELIFEAYSEPADNFHSYEAWAIWQHGKVMRAFTLLQQVRQVLAMPNANELKLSDPGVQKRLASQWGYVLPTTTAPKREAVLTDEWLLEQVRLRPRWEISTSRDPECDSSVLWHVHEVRGSRNDLEWFLIGEGDSPRTAIIDALRVKRTSNDT